ncbi:MAG: hypothetical protein Q7S66_03810 [bacterium]|nr:hypothetical protein [bacterium]
MISIKNLFFMSYWFDQPYIARGWVMWVWVGGFLAIVLVGLILRIWRQVSPDREIKEAMRRFSNLGLSMGVIGLIWMWLRQERVPFLAWRFWLLFWLLGFIWWLAACVRYTILRIPQIKKAKAERLAREKYLPSRN